MRLVRCDKLTVPAREKYRLRYQRSHTWPTTKPWRNAVVRAARCFMVDREEDVWRYRLLGAWEYGMWGNGESLLVRIRPDATDAALAQPAVRVFDMTGRPMKGWIIVDPAGLQSADDLKHWIEQGMAFAQSLPHK